MDDRQHADRRGFHVALTVSPNGTVFAAELTPPEYVFRSTNQGATWVKMDDVVVNTHDVFNGFVADPTDSNIVYLSGLFTRGSFPFSGRVVRGDFSKPAGSQWVSIASTQDLGLGTAPHTDSRVLVFNAGNRLIEGDDGGIYELNIANVGSEGDGQNGGGMWRSLNGNLHVSEMHSMAYDRVARIVIGGAQDTGYQEQLIFGDALWDKTSNGDGGDAAVDLLAKPGQTVRYGSSQFLFGFYRHTYNASNVQTAAAFPALTTVSGTTLELGSGKTPFVTPLASNAVAANRLIISSNTRLYESTDGGNTVAQIGSAGANQIAQIAYGGRLNGANEPGVVFIGAGATVRFRTAASGNLTGNIAFPGGTVQGIKLDPENWRAAYILGNNSVYFANDIATNGAAAFTDLTGNLTGVGQMHTIQYLTLPDGNAIVVGTDIGAYIMRLASPGVWRTLGNNLPHAPVYDSHYDPIGRVLTVSCFGRGVWLYDLKPTKVPKQYGETFQAYTENTSSFPARVGEFFSNSLGTAARIADKEVRELQLTADGTGGTRTAFRLPDLTPGQTVPAFSAKWSGTVYGSQVSGIADGFSFNFGPLAGVAGSTLTSGTYLQEDGFNAGLAIGVRVYGASTPGYYVRVNGTTVPGGFVAKPMGDWGNFNSTRHFFEVDWRVDTGLTLRVDGVAIFTNLATPGFAPAAGDRFVFGARTGGLDCEMRIDNLIIFTGGVLAPITPVAPYHFSGEFLPNEGAAKAFDGNPSTKWLTSDYDGFIGASIPSGKTVRAYTLTSANDFPTRDPHVWDFQTGDDGNIWTQHGAQHGQHFVNRFERRAFVVAEPVAATKFRLFITENNDDLSTQLAEFQPWEFVSLTDTVVTNTNDSGAGSLRQALATLAAVTGPTTIEFAAALSGQTITLASDLNVAPPDLTVDASNLPSGLTIDGGPGTNRIFSVAGGTTLNLIGLTLMGGNGTGSFANDAGGAILNNGVLNVDRCTLLGNSSSLVGGAIHNNGTATVTRSTLVNNSSAFGGAIFNLNNFTVRHSTIASNSATNNGGGIDNGSGTTIVLTLDNSIVAGNTASLGADVYNFNGTVTRQGANIVPVYAGVPATGSGTISTANPLLAPLDNYGGPTRTRALIVNSPARNASVGSTIPTDQRGFPIIGTADIGAYEAGTFANYNAYIWESLPAGASIAQHDMAFDFDGDGVTNANEFFALTDAGNPGSFFRITAFARSGGAISVTYTTALGRYYDFEYTEDLMGGWTPLPTDIPGTGNPLTSSFGGTEGLQDLFIRVLVGP